MSQRLTDCTTHDSLYPYTLHRLYDSPNPSTCTDTHYFGLVFLISGCEVGSCLFAYTFWQCLTRQYEDVVPKRPFKLRDLVSSTSKHWPADAIPDTWENQVFTSLEWTLYTNAAITDSLYEIIIGPPSLHRFFYFCFGAMIQYFSLNYGGALGSITVWIMPNNYCMVLMVHLSKLLWLCGQAVLPHPGPFLILLIFLLFVFLNICCVFLHSFLTLGCFYESIIISFQFFWSTK